MQRTLFCLLALAASATVVEAQIVNDFDRSRYSAAAYYNYAEPGDLTILVNVWGTVRNPGLYEVPEGTTLQRLISLSGGPNVTVGERRQQRTVTMRLLRGEATILDELMKDNITTTSINPVLQENDVLTIEMTTKQLLTWRDIVQIINTTAVIALALERISNVN